jgi:hypothetical protein
MANQRVMWQVLSIHQVFNLFFANTILNTVLQLEISSENVMVGGCHGNIYSECSDTSCQHHEYRCLQSHSGVIARDVKPRIVNTPLTLNVVMG